MQSVKSALPGIRITVIQPSPYDDVTRAPVFAGGYNSVLIRYGQFLKDLARSEALTVADMNTPVVAALEKAKGMDAAAAAKLIPDRVHPDFGGHLLMAAALLKSWNAPAVVSDVGIDIDTRRVPREANAAVSGLETKPHVSWTQEDKALPMPLDQKDAVLALALKSSDFLETLNRQMLRVHGLGGGEYQLRIDGQAVGTFTAAQLSEGINLAGMLTPMAQQAAEVHALTVKHNNIHFARWRQVQVPLQDDQPEHLAAAMEALDTLEADLLAMQRKAAQPRSHRYELAPQ